MQKQQEPEYPLLYSLQGLQYCDLLRAATSRIPRLFASRPAGACGVAPGQGRLPARADRSGRSAAPGRAQSAGLALGGLPSGAGAALPGDGRARGGLRTVDEGPFLGGQLSSHGVSPIFTSGRILTTQLCCAAWFICSSFCISSRWHSSNGIAGGVRLALCDSVPLILRSGAPSLHSRAQPLVCVVRGSRRPPPTARDLGRAAFSEYTRCSAWL